MNDVTKHQCAAEGCTRQVPTNLLMCIFHWRVVPRLIQQRVWAGYRAGGHLNGDPEYTAAVNDAVQAVAIADGRRAAGASK